MKDAVKDVEVDYKDGENSLNSDAWLDPLREVVSVPYPLRKVLGDEDGRRHSLVVIGVHMVMLESGFVGFDNAKPWGWGVFALSLSYTLPESLSRAAAKSIVLEFRTMGKCMNVNGTLSSGEAKRGVYSVRLNEDELVPPQNVVWANCDAGAYCNGRDGQVLIRSPEKEMFKFWRTVKDNLVLPLLIDFRKEAGFQLPPCLMRLPTDLKLKIVKLLPGVDVAKVRSVCSEFRYLDLSDDLWKSKLNEEFPNEKKVAGLSWEKAYSMAWSRQNANMPPQTWHETRWPDNEAFSCGKDLEVMEVIQ